MHEYSVVSELISSLLPRLEGVSGRILSVHLQKGELRILSDWALIHAFEVLSEGTQLEGAVLEIESVGVTLRCRGCGYEGRGDTLCDEIFHFAVPVLTCPRCKGEVDVLSGRELYVDKITLADDEAASHFP
jgi:hydrogenase nickel incorporation protein HypA/HybF